MWLLLVKIVPQQLLKHSNIILTCILQISKNINNFVRIMPFQSK
ncbi:hypothetical protein BAZSYMB_SCAFFOLD00114_4 [Bathymodiolus azoricus thioautotrophic gill symbiont]|uniref:Uncharacterized protein n=1 Tax=Bathymodiolus azoricus thioautotrophic gill symbiont TaxID=235205 RepID=A0A1H6LK86_9GAMM|nr:hypothetical protein BAZSYMB_SCAFFOLD00114_4 [Bathymodiolus azoricus thioautotrophic gill symbiont]